MSAESFANKVRYYTIDMIKNLGFGHLGGALSMADILSVLYEEELRVDPSNPKKEDRDYFVLSKGHGGPSLYATLALKGYFPIDKLYTLNKAPTTIPSHPDRLLIPGVDATTGSLGQGISQAVGIALGLRLKDKGQRVYSIVGDGELQEGQCWEAIENAAHEKLSNIVMFIDVNRMQLDGKTNTICESFSIFEKVKAFGWNAIEIDGHNLDQIRDALKKAKECKDKPTAVVANTIKGKGIVQFENDNCPHHIKLDDTNRPYLEEALNKFKELIK